jgi:hypothetical protein
VSSIVVLLEFLLKTTLLSLFCKERSYNRF